MQKFNFSIEENQIIKLLTEKKFKLNSNSEFLEKEGNPNEEEKIANDLFELILKENLEEKEKNIINCFFGK